jgi:hypothetical protein
VALAFQQGQAGRPVPHVFAHAIALRAIQAALGVG